MHVWHTISKPRRKVCKWPKEEICRFVFWGKRLSKSNVNATDTQACSSTVWILMSVSPQCHRHIDSMTGDLRRIQVTQGRAWVPSYRSWWKGKV